MLLCRTRSVTREEKNLSNFLKRPADKWVENSFEVVHTVMPLHIALVRCEQYMPRMVYCSSVK